MRKIYLLFLLISLFLSCKSVNYKNLVDKAAEGNKCFLSMEEAKKSLELLERAIELKPHEWLAYSREISIYGMWSHISKDFSDNPESIKRVFDKWIENGNSFNRVQKCCYANTLYTLGEYEKAEKYHQEIFDWYLLHRINFNKHETEYFVYMFAGIMLDEINTYTFGQWKLDCYDVDVANETSLNDLLLEIIREMKDPEMKYEIVKGYCIC